MSKVFIDRAVLEATLEHAEFVSGAACEAYDAIRAVLVAPSGTPVMPVKAYYHEAPNEHGGLNKSVGLEQRNTFADAPLVLESDALVQIACLEGEIAKRDARIAELEADRDSHQRCAIHAMTELAAIKAQELVWRRRDGVIGCKVFMSDKCYQAQSATMKANYERVAPVAKPQGVVMLPSVTEVMNIVFDYQHNKNKNVTGTTNWAANIGMAVIDEIARLNAAPVQQVSVPNSDKLIGLLESVRLSDDEAKQNSIGSVYWNNAVVACQVVIRDALSGAHLNSAPTQQKASDHAN